MYAQYFVKYVQQNEAQGNHIDYVSVQNEPTCCGTDDTGYASMNWNGSGLLEFTKNHLFPALRAAGLTTKVLILDYNWGNYNDLGSVPLADAALRNDPNFGGIAWHGYGGDVNLQTPGPQPVPGRERVHDRALRRYLDREPAGRGHEQPDRLHPQLGQVVGQVEPRAGPEPPAVRRRRLQRLHRPGHRAPQRQPARVRSTKTVEYYTMGHLTKFVKPGAVRIDSTANNSVKNVAWKNPDGSKALIAYNTTGSSQSVRVNWGSQSFVYTLPTKTSATFTWSGSQSGGGGGGGGQITGLAGKCIDVAGANSADGTGGPAVRLQRYDGPAVDPAR